ncbi:hypothetical protein H2Y54_00070 [Pectobacterium aroidearum]|uniref:hypothetical protein n=1 Tax=Pectobacterium aroidearum TaxID=1201031 RepID=UPI0015F0451D|nr:hypothetical protein [Pectobacterium aroidearum]MBA5234944.1 hypothetical protein [Pectobacterium aroidearum]
MKLWLDTYIGTDIATYLGLAISVVTVFGAAKVFKIRKQKNINQSANKNQGDVYQAGGNINQTINNYIPSDNAEADNLKKKNEYDLKIIEEILVLLPYEETIGWVEQSYISGLRRDVCLNMEKADKFCGENYRLYNHAVNKAKDLFIQSITSYVNSTLPFLHVDHPDRLPLMLNIPHDWKYKGEKSERNFRKHQDNMRETSSAMIGCYNDFIRTFKAEGFITDKL